MRRELFLRIVSVLEDRYQYFQRRVDATGKKGLSPLQKCTTAIRQLAYGAPADHCDEYLRVAETTAIECLHKFCRGVMESFGEQYLRRPNGNDIQRLLEMHEEKHGFPGMLGSLDCMHWEWKNCPVAWKGSRNDINVLHESNLFNDVLRGDAPEVNFTVNGTHYTNGYYLADGIYPEWATFVKSFPCPQDPKRQMFKKRQEGARKDVERAFGVLQSRWSIIKRPGRFWYKEQLRDIMYSCIILHNMIVEDEGDKIVNWTDDEVESPKQVFQGSIHEFQEYLRRNSEMRSNQVHHQLRADLVEHIWAHSNHNL